MTAPGVTVVVPTLGRPSLTSLLTALAAARPGPLPLEIVLVDDRPGPPDALPVPAGLDVTVVQGRCAGPAAARNDGWRAARHEWIAFLDDDVLPDPDWPARLGADLAAAGEDVGGSQGNLRVPLPPDRRPTDWERVTAGLADGAWITADMAYRRAALERAGGFDERLPRAFREDAELAFRVRRDGWSLRRGERSVTHPVRPENRWVSVRTQRGNADDALLRRVYGPRWRTDLEIPAGRRPRHAAVTAAGLTALTCGLTALATRRRAWAAGAVLGATAWAAGTAEFAAARIKPGPRDRREVVTMLATSAVIPPYAIAHWLRGWWRWRAAQPMPSAPARPDQPEPSSPGGRQQPKSSALGGRGKPVSSPPVAGSSR